jgi:hypothetical protein
VFSHRIQVLVVVLLQTQKVVVQHLECQSWLVFVYRRLNLPLPRVLGLPQNLGPVVFLLFGSFHERFPQRLYFARVVAQE